MIAMVISCLVLLIIDIMQTNQIKKLKLQLVKAKKGSEADGDVKCSVIDYTD